MAYDLADMKGRIKNILNPLLKDKTGNICIIDPPGHPNVGDSAILLGELDFIRENFPKASIFFFDVDNYSERSDRFIDDASVLLIHGGGNFGDIWPHHHKVRSRILDRFPGKPIIQLPQSIHFSSDEECRRTAALIDKQSNFTLMVRDRRSQAYAEKHFGCPVVLSPDMAFAMRPMKRKPSSVDYFALLRTDKEGVIDQHGVLEALRGTGRSVEVADWLDDPETLTMTIDRALTRVTRRAPAVAALKGGLVMRQRERYARQRLAHGIDLLSRGATVVADRLHAHILCALLGVPHYVFDSFDGKISAFNSTWEGDAARSPVVTSADFERVLKESTPLGN